MTFALNEKALRQQYRLLNHGDNHTQMHCQDVEQNRLVARELVKGEDNAIKFARKHNGRGNIFLGRNPRNGQGDVASVTSITFDIDPAQYDKTQGSTDAQLEACIRAGKAVLAAYPGGSLALSGNGVLLIYVAPEPYQGSPSAFADAFRDFTRAKIAPLLLTHTEAKLDELYDCERLIKAIGTISCRGARRVTRFLGVPHHQGEGRGIFQALESFLLQPSPLRGTQPGELRSEEGRTGPDSGSGSAQGLRSAEPSRVLGLGNEQPRIPYGQRHSYLVSVAGALRRKGLGEDSIFKGLQAAFEERCELDPKPDSEAFRRIARSVAKYQPGEAVNGTLSRLAVELSDSPDNLNRIVLRSTANSLEDYKLALEKRGTFVTPELPFGFSELDRTTWGLRRGELHVVAARTGVGKSSFCTNIALGLLQAGKKVLFLSTEMKYDKVFDRFISVSKGIPGAELKSGQLSEPSKSLLQDAYRELPGLPLSVIDKLEPSIAHVEKAVKECPPDVLIFDHIQHIEGGQDTRRAISSFVKGLKRLALEHDMAVLAVSQVGRPMKAMNFETKEVVLSKITMYDLKETGDIENEAGLVVLLHPTHNNLDETTTVIDVEIAKNRDGEPLYTSLAFDGSRYKFKEFTGATS